MTSSARLLNASEAATRLGVSAKALRIYEQRGLIAPVRTAAGWRAYGPHEMNRAAEIVSLRALGFSLAQITLVMDGKPDGLEAALAEHQASLEGQLRGLVGMIEKVGSLRSNLARGEAPSAGTLARIIGQGLAPAVAFDLPWPWGGERFELMQIRPLNYITGPLGCGKTRLAQKLAEALPDAAFIGLDRMADGGASARSRLNADAALRLRVEKAADWLVEDGATISDALIVLLTELEAESPAVLVIDMIEQGLDEATQAALMTHLQRRGESGRRFFMLTRSSAILDLEAVGTNEAIIHCPANHSPPILVAPFPGARGYESVAACLASTEVRARTDGVIAIRSPV